MDPSQPQTWARLRLAAIAGLQRKNTAPATEYLRFVEQHRGREAAEQEGRQLHIAKRHPAHDPRKGKT